MTVGETAAPAFDPPPEDRRVEAGGQGQGEEGVEVLRLDVGAVISALRELHASI